LIASGSNLVDNFFFRHSLKPKWRRWFMSLKGYL